VTGVWRFERPAGRGYSRCRSLPGHLIHLLVEGEYCLRINGRSHQVGKGDVIYYYEAEEVEWLGNEVDVVFHSVGFLAPSLAPPSIDRRVVPSSAAVRRAFGRLHAVSLQTDSAARTCGIMSALLAVLAEICAGEEMRAERKVGASPDNPWWRVEAALRRQRQFRMSLDEMAALANVSRASLVRCCRTATGLSPWRRLSETRMEEAKGLLVYSGLTVSQIAEYLGYPRLHEFSREFSRRFGTPPRTFAGRSPR
jgi:AraC-like DNA-binding protein